MVRAWARSAFPWLTWLYVASLLIQVFLAGLAVFNDPAAFHTHVDFGRVVVGLLTLLLPIVAWVGQLPTVRLAAGILLFYLLQTGLPEVRASLPMVAALHPVLGARPLLARRATRERGAARLVRSRSEPPVSPGNPRRAPWRRSTVARWVACRRSG